MSTNYRIPLGTLRRLTGHVHTPRKSDPLVKELVEFAANECQVCRILIQGFDEGFESAEAAQHFNLPLHSAMNGMKGN